MGNTIRTDKTGGQAIMEQLTQDYKDEMTSRAPQVVEIYDIFLTDGTHLRLNSSGQDMQFVDFEEQA
jgi:predicted heme/steroid binding protein